jgi:isocitrate dehydrogenase (NAD+)
VHGSAPDIAGRGVANPTALMLSAVMMLHHLGQNEPADRLQSAIEKVYEDGKHVTGDIGGRATTREFTDAIVAAMQS